MLNHRDREFLFENAYIPEHIDEYVCSISDVEPFLYNGYTYYLKDNHLIFIGYPLNRAFINKEGNEILRELILKHKAKSVATIGEVHFYLKGKILTESLDHYYRLDVSNLSISSKLKNSIKRAKRELIIDNSKIFTAEHRNIVDEYLLMKKFDEYTTFIFKMLPDYIEKSKSSLIINAKTMSGILAGFNIIDLGAKNYAFYMFNFISRKNYVPGISDLLMYEMIKISKEAGKKFINLGLGINEGVVFFKKKWGGEVFLNYVFTLQTIDGKGDSMKKKLLSFIRRYF